MDTIIRTTVDGRVSHYSREDALAEDAAERERECAERGFYRRIVAAFEAQQFEFEFVGRGQARSGGGVTLETNGVSACAGSTVKGQNEVTSNGNRRSGPEVP